MHKRRELNQVKSVSECIRFGMSDQQYISAKEIRDSMPELAHFSPSQIQARITHMIHMGEVQATGSQPTRYRLAPDPNDPISRLLNGPWAPLRTDRKYRRL